MPSQSQAIYVRHIGINYSGAETSGSYLPALRVYAAEGNHAPAEVSPPPAKKYWSRRTLAEWLVHTLADGVPTAVGINHAFSFPFEYFLHYSLPPDWRIFLDDFGRHWPTGEPYIYVDFVREGINGNGAARQGYTGWLRLTEIRQGRRPSVFHFDRPGSVAKATHAGLPWLRFLDIHTSGRLHFWPFDGWDHPPGKSMVAEVYPALCGATWPQAGRTPPQHAAFTIAAWLQQLGTRSQPILDPAAKEISRIEGWILGVR